ncbi:hypothetical protein Taro_002973, partial [Colocasia esculenta]|nr:hypothetical protein [Colocasia esculenta]
MTWSPIATRWLLRCACPTRIGLVAVALTVAMVSRRLRRARQDLVYLGRAVVFVLSLVFRFLGPCCVCQRWPTALLGVSGSGVVRAYAYWACPGYKPAVMFLLVVAMPVLFRLVVSFPARSECELQESGSTVAGCACFERGCWFARAVIGFVVSLRVRVGVRCRTIVVAACSPYVASSVSCKRERLYCELRVSFLQVLG